MRHFTLKLLVTIALLCGGLAVMGIAAGNALPRGDQLVMNAVRSTGGGVYLLDADRGLWAQVVVADGYLTNMSVSPDGTRIAYTVGGVERPAGGRSDDVYALDLRSMTVQPVAATPADENLSVWSPDGSLIAYSSDGGGVWAVVVADANGGAARQLAGGADVGFRAWGPRWSPDSSLIAFVSDRSAGAGLYDIYIVDVASGDIARMTARSRQYLELAWSPDGSHLLYTAFRGGTTDVYVMNVVSGAERNLSDNIATDDMAVWSPDGARIAFRSRRGLQEGIYLVDVVSEDVRRLAGESAVNFLPAWSLDGGRIAYTARLPDGRLGLYVLPPDDDTAQPVRVGTANFVRTLVWRPQ